MSAQSHAGKVKGLAARTFEEVSGKAGLVDRPIGHKLHPERVRSGAHVVGLVVAAEPADKRARLQRAVPHLQVVVGAAVVPLNLGEHTAGKYQIDILKVQCVKSHDFYVRKSLLHNHKHIIERLYSEYMKSDLVFLPIERFLFI